MNTKEKIIQFDAQLFKQHDGKLKCFYAGSHAVPASVIVTTSCDSCPVISWIAGGAMFTHHENGMINSQSGDAFDLTMENPHYKQPTKRALRESDIPLDKMVWTTQKDSKSKNLIVEIHESGLVNAGAFYSTWKYLQENCLITFDCGKTWQACEMEE